MGTSMKLSELPVGTYVVYTNTDGIPSIWQRVGNHLIYIGIHEALAVYYSIQDKTIFDEAPNLRPVYIGHDVIKFLDEKQLFKDRTGDI